MSNQMKIWCGFVVIITIFNRAYMHPGGVADIVGGLITSGILFILPYWFIFERKGKPPPEEQETEDPEN